MVGGLGVASRTGVDGGFLHEGNEGVGDEHEVDPEAVILFKSALTVIPPGEGFRGLAEEPEAVAKSERLEALQGAALCGRTENLPFPVGGVPRVGFRGGDVEVAAENEARRRLEELSEVPRERGDPVELVEILARADFLSVREVGAAEADGVASGGGSKKRAHEPLLVVGVARNIEFDRFQAAHGALPRDERHAVVGLLTREDRVEARLAEGFRGEKVVGELGFLKDERVGSGELEPLKHLRQADLERIDIPGGKTKLRHGGGKPFRRKPFRRHSLPQRIPLGRSIGPRFYFALQSVVFRTLG